jgi:hypothetical protein
VYVSDITLSIKVSMFPPVEIMSTWISVGYGVTVCNFVCDFVFLTSVYKSSPDLEKHSLIRSVDSFR